MTPLGLTILGTEGGSYYSGERALTIDNADAVMRAIEHDGPAVVRRTVEIPGAGRAPKNDPAIFVLALAASRGDEATRQAAVGPGRRLPAPSRRPQAMRVW